MTESQFDFDGFTFTELFQTETLVRLDQQFLKLLRDQDTSLYEKLLAYRQNEQTFSPIEMSKLLIACAPILEDFIEDLFGICEAVKAVYHQTRQHQPIFEFKKWFVLRWARRRLKKKETLESFAVLDAWLTQTVEKELAELRGLQEFEEALYDRELAVAQIAQHYLTDQDLYAKEIEKLIHWCIRALTTPEGQAAVEDWISFRLPEPLNHQQLVPLIPVANDSLERQQGPYQTRRQRSGFKLTDSRMSAREVQNEIYYCIYCHDHDGDFCAKGFPTHKNSKTQPTPEVNESIIEFKRDPLGNILTGCPLGEKISEMHWLKRQGYTIAALAVLMIDNPLCPVTGHRICNDCMKACIYQKQKPVNIPQIETRILTDVLELPWGVEIYDLLTRFNPLRQQQWVPKPYNGLKVLIAGQGPAGFTLAHHLLMEGFAVVGIDGLKIEPLADSLLNKPIIDYALLEEQLDERIIAGFGGVAEYGITVRWDKNFLKLIYLSLSRRPYFQVYGNVRFGGTLMVEDAWTLGFDHLAIAVGAGLPQALPIPGSLAPGMRQAADFLMTLQLTGAAKTSSLAHLQVRLPGIVIGGGLTAIDTATEVQAYYLAQIEKILFRYEKLAQTVGEAQIREQLDEASLEILDEWLTHARELQAELKNAEFNNQKPDIQSLLTRWGGVTVVYRRRLQESPAYRRNHEEIIKALEEGIFFLGNLQPKQVQVDKYGQVQALVGEKQLSNKPINSEETEEIAHTEKKTQEVVLPARSIFVATGAKPNVAYEFEHRGHFQREGIFQYQPYHDIDGSLQPVPNATHCKIEKFGPFTSYQHEQQRITFIGDTHPAFHGSVVKAVASGMKTYPHIVKALQDKITAQTNISAETKELDYLNFIYKIQNSLSARVEQIQRKTPTTIELKIRAPLAAKNFQPGQFFRLQNFETLAPLIENTRLQMEALALRCAGIDRKTGLISLMIIETGTSSRLSATLSPGQPVALMGPTGTRTKIYAGGETIMIIGGRLSAADIRTVGPAQRAAGNRILYIASFQTAQEIYDQALLEAATDVTVWITHSGPPISTHRPQDVSATGELLEILIRYANGQLSHPSPPIALAEVTQVHVIGSNHLVRLIAEARQGILQPYLTQTPSFTVSVHAPMQCMLKGICAQCLQWQQDPKTKQRTKAVFACSWQDQPLDLIEIDNLDERLQQNWLQEHLGDLWLNYLLAVHEALCEEKGIDIASSIKHD
jgi:NADPH-dependent glutamate synthase beta subunit-like oxidoreductase/NAD(P)H-flavin reductase